jgi:hypothetical protein
LTREIGARIEYIVDAGACLAKGKDADRSE